MNKLSLNIHSLEINKFHNTQANLLKKIDFYDISEFLHFNFNKYFKLT